MFHGEFPEQRGMPTQGIRNILTARQHFGQARDDHRIRFNRLDNLRLIAVFFQPLLY